MAKSNKKILIIGGAGFIGSHLSEAFLKSGKKIIIIDDFSTAIVKNFSQAVKIYKINIENKNKVRKIFQKEKPKIVYHLAGAMNLRRQITDPLFISSLNILGRTKTILDCCLENKVKKIIFLSSGGAIYSNAKIIPTPESYPAHPTSLYGLANLIIEKYIEFYYKKYGLNYIVLRLSNVYGPRQMEDWIISSLIVNLLKKKRPIIYGDGKQTRDFVYVDDVVMACILAGKKGRRKIYNVASGKEVSLNNVFNLLKKMFNSKINPCYKKLKIKEVKRSILDIKKIKKELGWYPQTNLKDGLIKIIKCFRK